MCKRLDLTGSALIPRGSCTGRCATQDRAVKASKCYSMEPTSPPPGDLYKCGGTKTGYKESLVATARRWVSAPLWPKGRLYGGLADRNRGLSAMEMLWSCLVATWLTWLRSFECGHCTVEGSLGWSMRCWALRPCCRLLGWSAGPLLLLATQLGYLAGSGAAAAAAGYLGFAASC